jgi:hypothetical protein
MSGSWLNAAEGQSHCWRGPERLTATVSNMMFWHPCDCGHTSDDHYRLGMARKGGCKQSGCSCKGFNERRPGA